MITFDTKGGNELIEDDYNGIIVKNSSSDQIVDAITQYNKNTILYEKHKKNTVTSIESFDLSLITKKTIKIYEEMIK